MTPRSARRREQIDLATSLRDIGRSPTEIARELRERYDQNPLAAMRLAHGWSQADAAAAWNDRWPGAPRTFKNFSYWENWPGPTGHAPSLAVLDGLAELYGCAVSDLLGDWGDHRDVRPAGTAEPAALAWQVRHLNLNELVHAVTRWSLQLPDDRRRADLLKLSTAAAAVAAEERTDSLSDADAALGVNDLTGLWTSTYSYPSTSRAETFTGVHLVDISREDGRMIGRSRPHETGSELTLSLTVQGSLVTGTWRERTSPWGHYRAATYQGVVQLVLDPTVTTMTGQWLGISKRHTIKSGVWTLERAVHESSSGRPDTITTTVSDRNAPSATRR